MSRKKKLIRNLIIIILLLFGIGYFRGYYFSKEQCILESLRGLNGSQGEKAMEFDVGEIEYTIVTNGKEVSLVGTKKWGFLYEPASSSVGNKIDESVCFDTFGFGGSKMGMLIIVSRIDESVVRVEAELGDGSKIVFDEWHGNIAGIHIPGDDWYTGDYRAYDASNQIVGELHY